MVRPVRILACADMDPTWRWITPLYRGDPPVHWTQVSSKRAGSRFSQWERLRAGIEVRNRLKLGQHDALFSFAPFPSFYAELLAAGARRVPHIAFGFNFTTLPTGVRLAMMRRTFARIERFAVFSRFERELYSRIFGIPQDRFEFVYWGVTAPLATPLPRVTARRYVAALGGEARDYTCLIEAARKLPALKFIVVARPHNFSNLQLPDNVEVRFNVPFDEAWSLVWHADVSVVPLLSGETPNGVVTVVGCMYLAKALVVTNSAGLCDYVANEKTALTVPPSDPDALSRSIERLLDDKILAARLGERASAFARTHCTEQATVDYFQAQVQRLA